MPARPPGVWRAQGSLPSSARAAPGRSCTCSQGGGRVAGGAPVGGGARGGAQHAAQRRDGGTPRTLCRGRGAQVGTALDSGQGACTTLAPPLLLSPPAQPADGGGQPGRPRGALGPGQAVFRGRWVVGGGGGGGARVVRARGAPCVFGNACVAHACRHHHGAAADTAKGRSQVDGHGLAALRVCRVVAARHALRQPVAGAREGGCCGLAQVCVCLPARSSPSCHAMRVRSCRRRACATSCCRSCACPTSTPPTRARCGTLG